MRIAVYHNQPSGGARRALYELGTQLSRRHHVDVFTLETGDEKFLKSSDFAANVTVLPFRPRRSVRGTLYFNDLRRMQDLADLERASEQAARLIDDGSYDVALVDACQFVLTPSVLFYLRTPSAYYSHHAPRRFLEAACRPSAAPLSPYQRARSIWHAPANRIYDSRTARLDKRNFERASIVLTNSEHTRVILRDYYGRSAHVCHLGVDCDRFAPSDEGKGDYILSVGALEPHKGFDFLIRSISQCPEVQRPALVVAANTDSAGLGRELTRLADSLGVSLEIRTNVDPTGSELPALYSGARAFAFTAYSEPFGLVLLEAMASGLPVVSVAEGGPLEIVDPEVTGILVPREESAFAAALMRLVSDSELANSMGAAARRVVETDWTWEAAGNRLETHLAGLASRQGVPAA